MTFNDWFSYFKSNKTHFDHIDRFDTDRLTEKEIRTIKFSIQQFQKGENSEGKNLIKFAERFGNNDYFESIKLFIKEEQKHALVLGKVMELNGIGKIKEHWVDNVFRKLRVLSSIENSIVVLLTAEIIAAVYYIALKDSTRSKLLGSVCEQILIDEKMHINFQSFFLHRLYIRKKLFGKIYSNLFRKFLMTGTTIVVWHFHKSVLKEGGYGLKKFNMEISNEFNRTKDMITGLKRINIRTAFDKTGFYKIEKVA